MGYVTAREIRTFLGEDQAVRWHLQSNFYPPITLSFLPAVRRALALARAECWENKIELPSGYEKTVRESAVIFISKLFSTSRSGHERPKENAA